MTWCGCGRSVAYGEVCPCGHRTVGREPTVRKEDFKVEDLIAYRVWEITPSGYLRSWYIDKVWNTDGVMHGNPDADMEGVWAFKEAIDAIDKAGDICVWGSVKLWGTVVEHERGYRAEHARVMSIDGPASKWSTIKRLRARYNVGDAERVRLPFTRTRRSVFTLTALAIIITAITASFLSWETTLGVGWALSSVLAYGILFADAQRSFPRIAQDEYWLDVAFSAAMSLLFGPIAALAAFILTAAGGHGVKFR